MNTPSQLDLEIDKRTMEYLQTLAAELADRMEAIVKRHPAGTFEDNGNEAAQWYRGKLDEAEVIEVVDLPPPLVRKLGRPAAKKANKGKYLSEGLTQALLDWAAKHGSLSVAEFNAAMNYKPTSVHGVVAALARAGRLRKDPETAALYYPV